MQSTRRERRAPLAGALLVLSSACAADAGDPIKGLTNGIPTGSTPSTSYGPPTSSGASGGSPTPSTSTSTSTASRDAGVDPAPGDAAVAVTPSVLEVDYQTVDTGAGPTSQIQFDLRLRSVASTDIDLSTVTVRYWFTADGSAPSGLYFISYYSQNSAGYQDITHSVSGAFLAAPAASTTPTSDTALELSFAAGAGSLVAGGYVSVQVAVHGPGATGYSDEFTESNDYSYDPTKNATTSYQPSTRVTAYVGGQIVWGAEPGAPPVTAGADAGQAVSHSTDGGVDSTSDATAVDDAPMDDADSTADAAPADDAGAVADAGTAVTADADVDAQAADAASGG